MGVAAQGGDVPQDFIHAVVAANTTRKDVMAADILARRPRVVGISRQIRPPLVRDFDDFVRTADLVVANRRHAELEALGCRQIFPTTPRSRR